MSKYAIGSVLALVSGSALAELPAGVGTAITAAQADYVTAGGLVLAFAAATLVFRWVKGLLFG